MYHRSGVTSPAGRAAPSTRPRRGVRRVAEEIRDLRAGTASLDGAAARASRQPIRSVALALWGMAIAARPSRAAADMGGFFTKAALPDLRQRLRRAAYAYQGGMSAKTHPADRRTRRSRHTELGAHQLHQSWNASTSGLQPTAWATESVGVPACARRARPGSTALVARARMTRHRVDHRFRQARAAGRCQRIEQGHGRDLRFRNEGPPPRGREAAWIGAGRTCGRTSVARECILQLRRRSSRSSVPPRESKNASSTRSTNFAVAVQLHRVHIEPALVQHSDASLDLPWPP